jgi:uncharacterized membrane protein YkvA (DUF1232 family)
MDRGEKRVPVRSQDASGVVLWIQDIVRQARLAWRLMRDSRVPSWTKLIPPAALLYVLFPIDIIPDFVAGLGQLDDIAVVLIGVKLFIELSPREVVQEHLAALGARVREWRVVDEPHSENIVIEGELSAPGAGQPPSDQD